MLDSVMVYCPDCGRMVELFTDEAKHRCRCGKLLLREARPSCADWCAAAAECLGEAIDINQPDRRRAPTESDVRAKEYVTCIREMLRNKGCEPDGD